MLDRDMEKTLLPLCRREGDRGPQLFVAWRSGCLTGRIGPERVFAGDDLRRRQSALLRREPQASGRLRCARCEPIARRHGASVGEVVIAWTLAQPGITFSLCGARNPAQAVENARAGELRLSADELAAIDAAIACPSRAGGRRRLTKCSSHSLSLKRPMSSSSAAASTASARSASWRCRASSRAAGARRFLLGRERGAVAHGPRRAALSRERRIPPGAAVAARARPLLQNAPHWCRRCRRLVPVATRFKGMLPAVAAFLGLKTEQRRRPGAVIRAGLMLYDLLSRKSRTMPRHRWIGPRGASQMAPGITAGGGCRHSLLRRLGQPSRADRPRDGARYGSRCRDRRRCAGIFLHRGHRRRRRGAAWRDRLTGEQGRIAPRLVVNATGAWVDHVENAVRPSREPAPLSMAPRART